MASYSALRERRGGMIYVVDQNMMRSNELRALVSAEPANQFVIPDAAWEEMLKHERWEDTVRRSFDVLSSALDRTFVSVGVGELIRYEQNSQVPIGMDRIVPGEITEMAREIIRAVVSGSERIGEIRERIDSLRLEVIAERPSGNDIKERMLSHVERLEHLYGPEVTREIRSGCMNAEARLGLIKFCVEENFRSFTGFDLPDPPPFQLSQLVTTRFLYATFWYYERWLLGGLNDAKPKNLANDEFDKDHAVTASFFDNFLSKDQCAARCASDLRLMVDPGAEERLLAAIENHAIATGRIAARS